MRKLLMLLLLIDACTYTYSESEPIADMSDHTLYTDYFNMRDGFAIHQQAFYYLRCYKHASGSFGKHHAWVHTDSGQMCSDHFEKYVLLCDANQKACKVQKNFANCMHPNIRTYKEIEKELIKRGKIEAALPYVHDALEKEISDFADNALQECDKKLDQKYKIIWKKHMAASGMVSEKYWHDVGDRDFEEYHTQYKYYQRAEAYIHLKSYLLDEERKKRSIKRETSQ